MKPVLIALALGACLHGTAVAAPQSASSKPAPLGEDVIPSVAKLPDDYPKSWVLVRDMYLPSLLDGRTIIMDSNDPVSPLKASIRTAQFGSMLFAPEKREIYTAETFHSRLTRGERTDAITIWDSRTLEPKAEILLPGGKRQLSTSYSGVFQFVNGHKWAAVANFTPAQTITIVDLDARKTLSEIDLPGCSHIYPTGERGFTTFCADGGVLVTVMQKVPLSNPLKFLI